MLIWRCDGTANYETRERLPTIFIIGETVDEVNKKARKLHSGYDQYSVAGEGNDIRTIKFCDNQGVDYI